MIRTINELQKYILQDADDCCEAIFKRHHLMTSPGCSKEDIEQLNEVLPGMPDSYTSIIEKVNLNGISVGFFEVSPSSFQPQGMLANIIEGNKGEYLLHEYAKEYELYLVATISDYGVFVAKRKSPFKEGGIILIDEEILFDINHPRDCDIQQLAKNFEQFLIVAGNLNQIHREINEDNSNWEEKKLEFIERLKTLGVSEEYHEAWLLVF